jgi:hypothetical protein
MTKSNYSEKLQDPRWQRKRLEIMNRDNFTCKICGSKVKTLNVHHWRYTAGKEPWEYPENLLITVCNDCHKFLHLTLDIEDNGVLSPFDFVMKYPFSIIALELLINHKGDWVISFRKESNFYVKLSTLCCLKKFISSCDTNIFEYGSETNLYNLITATDE